MKIFDSFDKVIFLISNEIILSDAEKSIDDWFRNASVVIGNKYDFAEVIKSNNTLNVLYVVAVETFDDDLPLFVNKLFRKNSGQLVFISRMEERRIIGPWIHFKNTACLQCLVAQVSLFPTPLPLRINRMCGNRETTFSVDDIVQSLAKLSEKAAYKLQNGQIVSLLDKDMESFYLLKDPNCSVCSRWVETPSEVYYS